MKSNVIMLQYYLNGRYTDLLLAELNTHYSQESTDLVGAVQGWEGNRQHAYFFGSDLTQIRLVRVGEIHYFNVIELNVRYKDEFPLTVLRNWKPKWIRVGEHWENEPFTTDHGENADFILPWGMAVKDTQTPPGPYPEDPGVRREIPEELRSISPD